MPTFRFKCPKCNILIKNLDSPKYNYCPYCGIALIQRKDKVWEKQPGDSRDELISVEEFKRLLQPIIDLNGYSWLARRIGVHDTRIHAVFKDQKYVTFGLADRWLNKLGLTNALIDGTLTILEKPKLPSLPEPKYFEE